MKYSSTFFSYLQNATDCGFSERFIKTIEGNLHTNSSPFLHYQFKDIVVIQAIDCPSDKSTIFLIKTLNRKKGVFVEYWETRNNY